MSEERGVRSRKWYETIEQALQADDESRRAWLQQIERPEMQAMSDSHRAWQQQLQQAEMQAQAAAEAQAVVSDTNRNSPDVAWEAEAQRADEPPRGKAGSPEGEEAYRLASEWARMRFEPAGTLADVFGSPRRLKVQMSDPPQSEQPATDTSAGAVQRRINDVCQDLVAGRTTPAQQRGLGGAVERAGRIPAGSDAAVGRIARLPR